MTTTRSSISNRVLTCAWLAIMSLGSGVAASAQVSPNEILDPRLKSLEKQYLPQLKTINQEVFKIQFPVSVLSQPRGRARSLPTGRSGCARVGVQAL